MNRDEAVAQKYVNARRHPTAPLTIYNYTAKTQIEGVWNETTRECRGLIVHDDGTVAARAYRKFFNSDEPHAEIPASFEVFDKADGSLGITYRDEQGRICIATRGAFESEQAKHATALWRAKYDGVDVPIGQTWLFEIVYPGNRIVLDYAGMDDLILHGCVDTLTGADLPFPTAWPGPVISRYDAQPLDELLKVSKPNTEGFVLREHPLPADRPAKRVKVKLADYVRLHKLLSGITPHRIWECLARGPALDVVLAGVPDEFYKQAMTTAASLQKKHDDAVAACLRAWAEIVKEVGDGKDRKTFALRIKTEPEDVQPLLFACLSGKGASPIVWKQLEPSGADPMGGEA